MNPTLDNDLQKAIDDITKSTNADPVFGDAVAAPEPAMPKPAMPKMTRPLPPRPVKAPTMPAPEPAAPAPAPIAPAPMPEPLAPEPLAPEPVAPAPEPIAPAPMPPAPEMPTEISEETTVEAKSFDDEPIVSVSSDMQSVKEAALRDLAPILNKVDMDSSKKFGLYKDIHEELHDNSVIAPAYETAKEIADDKERADALLYLIDSIDNIQQ